MFLVLGVFLYLLVMEVFVASFIFAVHFFVFTLLLYLKCTSLFGTAFFSLKHISYLQCLFPCDESDWTAVKLQ